MAAQQQRQVKRAKRIQNQRRRCFSPIDPASNVSVDSCARCRPNRPKLSLCANWHLAGAEGVLKRGPGIVMCLDVSLTTFTRQAGARFVKVDGLVLMDTHGSRRPDGHVAEQERVWCVVGTWPLLAPTVLPCGRV